MAELVILLIFLALLSLAGLVNSLWEYILRRHEAVVEMRRTARRMREPRQKAREDFWA